MPAFSDYNTEEILKRFIQTKKKKKPKHFLFTLLSSLLIYKLKI